MAKPVEQQKAEWIENALKSKQCYLDKCDKCGSVRHGCYCMLDRTFKCVVCLADEIFYTPPPPKLDVDDFARM